MSHYEEIQVSLLRRVHVVRVGYLLVGVIALGFPRRGRGARGGTTLWGGKRKIGVTGEIRT